MRTYKKLEMDKWDISDRHLVQVNSAVFASFLRSMLRLFG